MKEYDVVVIGAGPGGAAAAKRAVMLGASVALIEKEHAGGVCLNWGCIPTKAMVASVSVMHKIQHAEDYGLRATLNQVSLANIVNRKNAIVQSLRSGAEGGYARSPIEYIQGIATIAADRTVTVHNSDKTTTLRAQKIIVATGSSSRGISILPFDDERILDAQSILEMKQLPASLAVIGGGAIGCEFASIFNALGVDVTIVEMQDRLIPLEEAELSKRLGLAFKKAGIKLVLSDPIADAKVGDSVVLTTKSGTTLNVQNVLVAVGRVRNSSGIGLESLDIDCDHDCVVVNEYCETNSAGIYAVGDLVDSLQLAHVAMYEGRLAAENAVKGNCLKRDYRVVPNCVFTVPEVASVGFTKEAALADGVSVDVAKELYSANGKAHCMGETEGFIKLVFNTDSGVILGGQIMGAEASDLIGEIALAIQYKLTVEDVANTIHEHPTLCEAIQDAALTAVGKRKRK